MIRNIVLTVIIVVTAGCATVSDPKPGTITLEEALISIGRGLVAMKQAQLAQNNNKEFKTGLLAAEAEVSFNIASSTSQDGKLYVELTPIPVPAPTPGGKAGVDIGTSYNVSRGNQIVIKFKSIAFSKKTTTPEGKVTIEGPTDPKLLKEIMNALEGTGITPYFVPSRSEK